MAKIPAIDIGKTASTATIVCNAIRKAIVEGALKDGEPLRQDEIAKLFNTSRIPVREALTMLEQQGLVKTERYRGAVVAGMSLDEAGEIFDFRALLEPEIIRKAVPNMSENILEEAQSFLTLSNQTTDAMEYGDLNRRFHATLYEPSGLPYHLSVISNSMDRIDRFLRAQMVLSDGFSRAAREHQAILDACQRGDSKAAGELTAAHILGAKHSLAQQLRNFTKS